jgi:hypothetical protein
MRRFLLIVPLLLAFAAPAHAGGPAMVMGTNDFNMLSTSLVASKANMTLAKLAGFRAISVREYWWPGVTEPRPYDLQTLGNVDKAAGLVGLRVYLGIMNPFGRYAPRTDEAQDDFAAFAAASVKTFPSFKTVIFGNEPNKNQFWAPQFAEDGSDSAAFEYEQLLAKAYDAVKAVSPKETVVGGALAPHGGDDPNASTKAHSPTTFIRDMGAAYRASGRKKPIMDAFSFHPYGDNSSQPPSFRHDGSPTITLGDYGKLTRLLGKAFNGTAQQGSTLPIIYDEYGIESTIPSSKASKYTGKEPKGTKPVPPKLQGERYREAMAIAFCQPNVKAMFLFQSIDEPGRPQWQSGVYYADHKPKPSLSIVREAMQEVKRGVIAHCAGLHLAIKAKAVFPKPPKAATAAKTGRNLTIKVRCNLDCRYTASVVQLPSAHIVLTKVGQVVGGKPSLLKLPARKLAKGHYQPRITMVAAMNPGNVVRKSGKPFIVG